MRRLLLLISVLILAACERPADPAAPTKPQGGSGGAAPRVVALGPAIVRTLTDAGHADRLVGRHAFDLWADPRLAVCGDQSGVDYEALLRVRPTHVLLQWGRRELPPRLERLGREHGWFVKNYPLLSLGDVSASADELWSMFDGPSPMARDPASLPSRRLAGALASAAPDARPRFDPARVGRVLLLAGVHPPTALGPGSYHHDMLLALGARSALTEGAPYVTMDAEDLLRLAPDAIVLVQPRWGPAADAAQPGPKELKRRLGNLGELDLPAIRHGRLALIDDPTAFIPGTNLIGVAEQLAGHLQRWGRPDAAP